MAELFTRFCVQSSVPAPLAARGIVKTWRRATESTTSALNRLGCSPQLSSDGVEDVIVPCAKAASLGERVGIERGFTSTAM